MQLTQSTVDEPKDNDTTQERSAQVVLVASRFPVTDAKRTTFFSQDTSLKYLVVPISSAAAGKWKEWNRILSLGMLLWRTVKKVKPDLIVLEDPRAGMPCCLLLKMLGVRIPIVIWNFNMVNPYKSFRKTFARAAINAAHSTVVYSRHEQELYAKLFDLPESKFRYKLYTSPCLDDARYTAMLDQSSDTDYVVSPGSWGRDYNLLAQVAAKTPSIRYKVLAIAEAVKGINFPANVEVVNGISELEYCRYIAKSRLCYVPVANQMTANGHIAIVQAMSFRKLLMTNATPGTADYIDNNRTIICSSTDADSIADQLLDAWEHGEKYSDVVDAGYSFARQNFGVDQDIAMIHGILASLDDRNQKTT